MSPLEVRENRLITVDGPNDKRLSIRGFSRTLILTLDSIVYANDGYLANYVDVMHLQNINRASAK